MTMVALTLAETVLPRRNTALCGIHTRMCVESTQGPHPSPHTSSLQPVGDSGIPHIPHKKTLSKGEAGCAAVHDKQELLLRLEAQRERFEEIAGFLEFEEGLPREVAEKLARGRTGWSGL